MYTPPKSTSTSRSRHSTERRAQFKSKVTTLTSRTYRSAYRKFSRLTRALKKRKGGGGKGGSAFPTHKHTTSYESFTHAFSAHVGGAKGSKGNGGKSSGKPNTVKLDGGNLPNNKKSATSYGAGGGRAAPISPGLPFAGRIAGGGNRQGVYGNRYAILFTRL